MNTLERSLLFFYTETPLHAGAPGGTGAIDLPIQRERITELPQVQASGIKGALREVFRSEEADAKSLELSLFGHRPPDNSQQAASTDHTEKHEDEYAGALAVTDARLLLLPLRSARGGWAWATSPMVLQRLARDIGGDGATLPWRNLRPAEDDHVLVGADCDVVLGADATRSVVVEDSSYRAHVAEPKEFAALAELIASALPPGEVYASLRQRVARQLVILPDEELFHWGRHGTEVVTRVRINPETGTVAPGALWTEEVLPSEALLWSVTMMSRCRRAKEAGREAGGLHETFAKTLNERKRIFLGGDRSIGRGVVALGFGEAR